MSLTHAEQNLKNRLQNCRKSHYLIPAKQLSKIRTLLRAQEVSKKAVCRLYGITYKDLKNQLLSLPSGSIDAPTSIKHN